MSKEFYFQHDERWGSLLWYDKEICELIGDVTKSFHGFQSGDVAGGELLETTARLSKYMRSVVEDGGQSSSKAGSLSESGCWHTSVSNMLNEFGIRLENVAPNPEILLKTLQGKLLGTLTGYVEHGSVDPLSIVTRGKVQLARYRDFGCEGEDRDNQELLDLLKSTACVNTCAIVNVDGHEFLGSGSNSHYVLVTNPISTDYEIKDPGYPDKRKLLLADWGRVYQVSVYKCLTG
ncbi:MAG: hypothetical protein RPS47_06970 [Colwellia sp.]|jgi:hypothetical protein